MKRLRIVLTALLTLAMLAALAGFAGAEYTMDGQPWQADILKLMDAATAPKVTTVRFETNIPDDQAVDRRSFNQELVSSRGDVLNVSFHFAATGEPIGEGQWATITQWLKELVLTSVQYVRADSESLAAVIAEGYRAQRVLATPGETGMPAWASPDILLEDIEVTVPWYPELRMDVNGAATTRLQERLIELGYLDDDADGYYGANTQAAVMALEEYVRALEQDVIDALPAPQAATVAYGPMTMARGMSDMPLAPAAQPVYEPVTPVDGVADGLLQAYLYSDDFKVCRSDLRLGDEGSAVTRAQTRLRRLGYTTDPADGIYGGGTARAIRVFQYYNGLDQTGVADAATQSKLFSQSAVQPDNAMLSVGSSGEAVSKLQMRLRVLGFASIAVDGGYGASTKAGVENLQRYMREMEGDALEASATTDGVSDAQLTVEVNGVADPLLLDDFYSGSFPEIPSELSGGSDGRDVVRLQRRLSCLEYYTGALDGQYGSGTARAVGAFQRRHRLPDTGVADRATMAALFNESAKKALKPYVLKVSVSDQKVYAYAPDENDEYTILVRTMTCSTGRKGTPTPTGTYTDTAPGARWHYFEKFKCWAQYAFYIQGDIMFHSVLYNKKDGPVTQSSVNHLGSRASHGCVRLSVKDAKWIWNNCPSNTKVIVF